MDIDGLSHSFRRRESFLYIAFRKLHQLKLQSSESKAGQPEKAGEPVRNETAPQAIYLTAFLQFPFQILETCPAESFGQIPLRIISVKLRYQTDIKEQRKAFPGKGGFGTDSFESIDIA